MSITPGSPLSPKHSRPEEEPTREEGSGSNRPISSAESILRKMKRPQHPDGPENHACKKLKFDEEIQEPTEADHVLKPNDEVSFEKMTLSDSMLNSFETDTLEGYDAIWEDLSTGTLELSDGFYNESSTPEDSCNVETVEWTDAFLALESTGSSRSPSTPQNPPSPSPDVKKD